MPANSVAAAVPAYVGLGSNLDGPQARVLRALHSLDEIPQTRLLKRSRLFRTAPWGMLEQPSFVNAAAQLSTTLPPRKLLEALLAIEIAQGRRRDAQRWGPRTLDLDLLSYGDLQMTTPGMQIPHPRIAERAFVLVPLADVDPDLTIAGVGRVRDLLRQVDAGECVPI